MIYITEYLIYTPHPLNSIYLTYIGDHLKDLRELLCQALLEFHNWHLKQCLLVRYKHLLGILTLNYGMCTKSIFSDWGCWK